MGWPGLAYIPDSQDAGKGQRLGSFPWLDEVKCRQKEHKKTVALSLKVTGTLPNPVEGLSECLGQGLDPRLKSKVL